MRTKACEADILNELREENDIGGAKHLRLFKCVAPALEEPEERIELLFSDSEDDEVCRLKNPRTVWKIQTGGNFCPQFVC